MALAEFDFATVTDTVFRARQYIPIKKQGYIHGVVAWFNVKLCEGIEISTAPDQIETHWKQAFFPFQTPIEVIDGDVLDWKVRVGALHENSDDTSIEYDYRCTQLKNESVRAVTEKTAGRNDPCPCGSGKKYKKCCLSR